MSPAAISVAVAGILGQFTLHLHGWRLSRLNSEVDGRGNSLLLSADIPAVYQLGFCTYRHHA